MSGYADTDRRPVTKYGETISEKLFAEFNGSYSVRSRDVENLQQARRGHVRQR